LELVAAVSATGLVVVGDLIGSGEARERGIVGETRILRPAFRASPNRTRRRRREHACIAPVDVAGALSIPSASGRALALTDGRAVPGRWRRIPSYGVVAAGTPCPRSVRWIGAEC
jgi:hypothetical protein